MALKQDKHLDLLDVVGGAGYERGRPEMAYFSGGKILHVMEHGPRTSRPRAMAVRAPK